MYLDPERWMLLVVFCLSAFVLFIANKDQPVKSGGEPMIVLVGDNSNAELAPVSVTADFVKNQMWPELLRMTKRERDLSVFSIPKILLQEKDPKEPTIINDIPVCALGRYFGDKIEIYRLEIYRSVKGFYEKDGLKFSIREWNIYIYTVIAHELLHHIYWTQKIPIELHHKKMQDDQVIGQISAFIGRELVSDGTSKILAESSIKFAVENNISSL